MTIPLPPEPDEPDDEQQHATLIDEIAHDPVIGQMVKEMQRRARAKEIFTEIEARKHPRPDPDCGTLAELLARPATDQYRINGLLPAGGRMTAVAQRKTGKTTLIGNLARSLLTGKAFLDRFPVEPIAGKVVILNYEVTGAQFARWMHDIDVPADRCYVINLRGRRNLLADAQGRTELVDTIRKQAGEVLIVDTFGRAYTGKSQNDAAEVTPWLVRLDEVAEQAGISEVILTVHAGWDGERTRGSTALEDWPDVIVNLARDPETDVRFLRAEGRDVDVPEDRVHYDPANRTLRMSGDGSRKQVRDDGKLEALAVTVRDIVKESPGMTMVKIKAALAEGLIPHRKGDENKAAKRAENRGWIRRESGPRHSVLHFPVVAPGAPEVAPQSPPGVLQGPLDGPISDPEMVEYPRGYSNAVAPQYPRDLPRLNGSTPGVAPQSPGGTPPVPPPPPIGGGGSGVPNGGPQPALKSAGMERLAPRRVPDDALPMSEPSPPATTDADPGDPCATCGGEREPMRVLCGNDTCVGCYAAGRAS